MEGSRFALAGVLMTQQLSSGQTGGAFSLFDNTSRGLSGTPIHTHAYEDETIYIIQGEMHAVIAGEERTLRPGESIFLPRGIPHQLRNEQEGPAHYLLLCTPGGFEAFLAQAGHALAPGADIGPPSATDLLRLKAAAPRFGITLHASWSAAETR